MGVGLRPEMYILVKNVVCKILRVRLVGIHFNFKWKMYASVNLNAVCYLKSERACLKSVVSNDSTNVPVTTSNQ